MKFAVSPPLISALIVGAVTMCVNQSLSKALTSADHVLNSLLSADLPYSVKGNDKDGPKFCNMRFDMD